jgi:hypothetical protein
MEANINNNNRSKLLLYIRFFNIDTRSELNLSFDNAEEELTAVLARNKFDLLDLFKAISVR